MKKPVEQKPDQSKSSFDYSLLIVLGTAVATFSAFYAPQPLLPDLGDIFNATPSQTAMLISVTFFILCAAPLIYGSLLAYVSPATMMLVTIIPLAFLQWNFALSENYNHLLLNRLFQGLLYPAIFTAAVTYCNQHSTVATVSRRVAWYVAATIVGGMAGRLLTGLLASYYGWQMPFFVLTFILATCAILLLLINERSQPTKTHERRKPSLQSLNDRRAISGLLVIFFSFFAFAGVLNTLPFRMVELDPLVSPATISFAYVGYLIGIVIALKASRIADKLGGALPAVGFAIPGMALGILLLSIQSIPVLIAVGFLTAGCMFLIHATLSALLNQLFRENAAEINGAYISVYYAAGALGSIIPVSLYEHAGWGTFTATVLSGCLLAFITLRLWIANHLKLRKQKKQGDH